MALEKVNLVSDGILFSPSKSRHESDNIVSMYLFEGRRIIRIVREGDVPAS